MIVYNNIIFILLVIIFEGPARILYIFSLNVYYTCGIYNMYMYYVLCIVGLNFSSIFFFKKITIFYYHLIR